jgi:hypothetical protein
MIQCHCYSRCFVGAMELAALFRAEPGGTVDAAVEPAAASDFELTLDSLRGAIETRKMTLVFD